MSLESDTKRTRSTVLAEVAVEARQLAQKIWELRHSLHYMPDVEASIEENIAGDAMRDLMNEVGDDTELLNALVYLDGLWLAAFQLMNKE